MVISITSAKIYFTLKNQQFENMGMDGTRVAYPLSVMKILKHLGFSFFLMFAFCIGLLGTLSAAEILLERNLMEEPTESFEQPVQAPQQGQPLNKLPTIEC